MEWLGVPLVLLLVVSGFYATLGRMMMGSHDGCDDGKTHINVDMPKDLPAAYTCPPPKRFQSGSKTKFVEECQKKADEPRHKCMSEAIIYKDIPPRSGTHRPVWPVYGEYRFLPPQRWLHSLEHGAAVFLYHPCADVAGIEKFRNISKSCIRKHIITPYRLLSESMPFGIITWKCRLLLSYPNEGKMVDYIRKRALQGPEDASKDGKYDEMLLVKAKIVSDLNDTNLCPFYSGDLYSHEYSNSRDPLRRSFSITRARRLLSLQWGSDVYCSKH